MGHKITGKQGQKAEREERAWVWEFVKPRREKWNTYSFITFCRNLKPCLKMKSIEWQGLRLNWKGTRNPSIEKCLWVTFWRKPEPAVSLHFRKIWRGRGCPDSCSWAGAHGPCWKRLIFPSKEITRRAGTQDCSETFYKFFYTIFHLLAPFDRTRARPGRCAGCMIF